MDYTVFAEGKYSLEEYDKTGSALSENTATGGGRGLEVDASGNYYIGHSNSLKKFDSTHTRQWSFGMGATPFDVYPTDNGYVYASDFSYLYKLNVSDGSVVWQYNHGKQIRALEVDPTNRAIYMSGTGNGEIIKIDSTGAKAWHMTGISNTYVQGVLVDSNENIYTGDNNGTVKKYDSTRSLVWEDTTTTMDAVNKGAVMAGDETPVFTGYNGAQHFEANGGQRWGFSFTGYFYHNASLAADGNLYAPDQNNSRVLKIDDTGTKVWEVAKTDASAVGAHPNYETFPGAWSSVAKVTATQVGAAGTMHAGSALETYSATQVGASGTMGAPTLTEFASASQPSASATVASGSLTEFATATKPGATGAMATPALTEFAGATQPRASATMKSGSTLDMLTAAQTTASATPTSTGLTEFATASKPGVAATMLAGSAQIVKFATATQIGATSSPNATGVKEFYTATQPTVTASMHRLYQLEYATATPVGVSATALSGYARLPNRVAFSDEANTATVDDTSNRAVVKDIDNEAN